MILATRERCSWLILVLAYAMDSIFRILMPLDLALKSPDVILFAPVLVLTERDLVSLFTGKYVMEKFSLGLV